MLQQLKTAGFAMKRFSHYVKMRESSLLDPTGQELKTADIHGKKDTVLNSIMKIAWDRYEGETREFISNLAKKDPQIKTEFDSLDSARHGTSPNTKSKTGDKDVIAMPPSDHESGDSGE